MVLASFTRLRSTLIALAATFVVIIVLCSLAILLISVRSTPPSVWTNPPLYPGAKGLQVADFGNLGTSETVKGTNDGTFIMKVLTYTVQAPESDVVSFYGHAFQTAGMEPTDWGRLSSQIKALNYSWTSGGRSPSFYFLDVITRPEDSEHTLVEIGASMFPGY